MTKPETLYHYCSTSTFFSIIQNREIWLSSLDLSNDNTEGKLVTKIMDDLLRDNNVDSISHHKINITMNKVGDLLNDFGLCLSKQGDLLSQWRAYASDGEGVSIGFSTDYLQQFNHLQLEPVIYNPSEQTQLVKELLKEPLKIFADPVFEKNVGLINSETHNKEIKAKRSEGLKAFKAAILELIPLFYKFKHEAFIEEDEWRLHTLNKSTNQPTQFHFKPNSLVPHLLEELDYTDSICEVILGPKHQTTEKVFNDFLQSKGFSNIRVKTSESPYR